MAKNPLYNDVLARPALASALRTNGTVNGTTVDKTDPSGGVDGFTSVLFVISATTLTDGTHTVTVQDSDDGTTYATAAIADVFGTPTSSVALTSANSNSITELGYDGFKRYCRVQLVVSGATTGGTLGAVAILGGETSRPVKR